MEKVFTSRIRKDQCVTIDTIEDFNRALSMDLSNGVYF